MVDRRILTQILGTLGLFKNNPTKMCEHLVNCYSKKISIDALEQAISWYSKSLDMAEHIACAKQVIPMLNQIDKRKFSR